MATAIWPLRRTVSIGNRTPSSKTWEPNVARAYMLGVSTGSIPSRERRKMGVEAEMRVGSVECRKVPTAMEGGTIHEGRDFSVGMRERGGCVDGVSISLVRAMSIGARMTPAMPAALTAVARLIKGFGDEVTSRPPTADGIDIR